MSKDVLNATSAYFNRAQSWADDNFGQLQQSRNRYQLAFLFSMGLNAAAMLAVSFLAGQHTLVPMLVHHYDNGITTVEPVTHANAPINKAQVESDIVRYITYRESYDVSSYRAQFDLITLLSNDYVGSEYLKEQDRGEKKSPINTLGANASRAVHIYSINFLDADLFNNKEIIKDHKNVAEVVFSVTDSARSGQKINTYHYSSLISWNYVKPVDSPAQRWQNWDGFQVIRYSKNPRNV